MQVGPFATAERAALSRDRALVQRVGFTAALEHGLHFPELVVDAGDAAEPGGTRGRGAGSAPGSARVERRGGDGKRSHPAR